MPYLNEFPSQSLSTALEKKGLRAVLTHGGDSVTIIEDKLFFKLVPQAMLVFFINNTYATIQLAHIYRSSNANSPTDFVSGSVLAQNPNSDRLGRIKAALDDYKESLIPQKV